LSSLLKISVSVIFIFTSLTASGGDPYRLRAGAAESGTGYSCITRTGFWSSFHNQALLPYINTLSASVSYEDRFGLTELGTRSAGVIIPAGKSALSAVYSNFGYSDFKRDMAGLACGMFLSKKLSAGVQVDYFSQRTYGEYNSYSSVTCEAGIILLMSENTRLGVHIFNPIPNSLRKISLPTSLRTGIGTYLNTSLYASAEAEMTSGNKLILRTGFEYEAVKKIFLRGGFCTEYNSFSFGIGFLVKIVQVDIGFVTHERLGITSSASLIFKMHQ